MSDDLLKLRDLLTAEIGESDKEIDRYQGFVILGREWARGPLAFKVAEKQGLGVALCYVEKLLHPERFPVYERVPLVSEEIALVPGDTR